MCLLKMKMKAGLTLYDSRKYKKGKAISIVQDREMLEKHKYYDDAQEVF